MENSLNFKDLFLSADDLEILANARYGGIVKVHPVSVKFLIKYGLISQYLLSDKESEFVITSLGLQYMKYLDKILLENDSEDKRRKKEEKRLKLAEIRSWMSILISLMALIGSLLPWLLPLSR